MYWRKWLVRTVVFSLVGLLVGAGLTYQYWTNPSAVREQVIGHLGLALPGADTHLEAARLRLLGGIVLTDLRLIRKDDSSRHDFAYVPSCILYHDKEQLLDGQLCFRKVELHRPRLRIIREKDGRWNLAGLSGSELPDRPLPTLLVQEGTVLFEDRTTPGLLPLEIHGVQLTLVNDPVAVVSVTGSGQSDVLGQVQFRGSWRRDTGEVEFALNVVGLSLSTALVQRVACWCPHNDHLCGAELGGSADIEAEVKYAPGRPLEHRATLRVQRGRLRHPALPLPLEEVTLAASCRDDQLTLESLSATSGTARIQASGVAELPCVQEHFQGKVSIQGLHIDNELCRRLPPDAQTLHALFAPQGPITVELDAAKVDGTWTKNRCRLLPEQISLCFKGFQYVVDKVIGEIDVDLLNHFTRVDLRTTSEEKPLTLRGTSRGQGKAAAVDLELEGKNFTIDAKLLAALPPGLRKLALSFNATGTGNFTGRFIQPASTGKFQNEFHIDFRDASVCWNRFAYLVEKITGRLDIYPYHWVARDFRGEHGESVVRVSGHSAPRDPKAPEDTETPVALEIIGQNVAIDPDLRRALKEFPGLARAWDTFSPGGRFSFRAGIDRLPGRPEDIDIAVNVRGCTICPDFFPCPLHDLSGQFRFARGRLELHNLQARHGLTRLAMTRGIVDFAPGDGYYAEIDQLYGNPVVLDDPALLRALPPNLRSALLALQFKDPVTVQTKVIVARSDEPGAQPDIWWDGRLWLHDARLKVGVDLEKVTGVLGCRGRHNGRQFLGFNGNLLLEEVVLFKQPLRGVHSHLQVHEKEPDVLRLSLHAPLFGGDISGEGRLEFHSNPRYELNLTLSQIDLKQLGNHNQGRGSELEGLAHGRLHLVGQPNTETLDGHGSIDVPSGKLYNLPWLLDLLKFLGLRWPDRTAFDEAHAGFTIQGQRVSFHRLDLWGNAISMTGKGEVNLDGTNVQFDFYPSWARLEQLLPPILRNVSPSVSKNLLQIEVRGKLGKNGDELKFHKKPVPMIMDPLRRLREQMLVLPALAPSKVSGE